MPGSVTALRLINLLLAGALTADQLSSALANPLPAGAFELSLRQRTVADALKASPPALKAIAGSYPAMCAVLRQDMTILDAIIASPDALFALTASSLVMGVSLGFSAVRSRFYYSDTALTAITASATAKAALRACAKYTLINKWLNNVSATYSEITGPTILVGWSATTASTVTLTGRRAGSTVGTLSGNVAQGTTAAIDNIMAVTTPLAGTDPTGATVYLGVVPVN